MQPNTLYTAITLQDAVVTGGYYLFSYTLQDNLFGDIHTYILPSLLTEGKIPELSIFTCWMVQYFHNAFVLNDSSDRDHLLSLSIMSRVSNFLAFLDTWTYWLSMEISDQDDDILMKCQETCDLNAISIPEWHQICHTWGLAMDLVLWFCANYEITDDNSPQDDIDTFQAIFIPFTVHIGHQIIWYKQTAMKCGHKGIGTPDQIQNQIKSAIFYGKLDCQASKPVAKHLVAINAETH